MSDRCTGRCCESFSLTCGTTLDEIDLFLRTMAQDGHFIADMIIPIRELVAGARFPNGEIVTHQRAPHGPIGWVFTCKHFDREKRVCTVYSERPLMCRDYPYGSPCEHSDCTWDKGRAGKHPPRFVQYEDKKLDETGRMHRRVHLKVLNNYKPPLLMKGPEQ